MPWLPLPELMTTGREHPAIRASEAAAAMALARVYTEVLHPSSSMARATPAP